MIISILNQAGSRDSAVLTDNLAALRARNGNKVFLIDTDPGASSIGWSRARAAANVRPAIAARAVVGRSLQDALDQRPRCCDVLIDTLAADGASCRSALVAARITLIPLRPEELDAAAEEKLVRRIESARLFNPGMRIIFVLLHDQDEITQEQARRMRVLASRIVAASVADVVLRDSPALAQATAQGMALAEFAPGVSAMAGLRALYRDVFQQSPEFA